MSASERESNYKPRESSLSLGSCFISVFIFLLSAMGSSSIAGAQWRVLFNGDNAGTFPCVYFLDLPGPPKIGFAGDESSRVFKTMDCGQTWTTHYLMNTEPIRINDFLFKDSSVGWLTGM